MTGLLRPQRAARRPARSRGKLTALRRNARGASSPRRLLRWLRNAVLFCLLASVFLVLVFRFLPPPLSGLMLERRIESWLQGSRYAPRYDWKPLENIAPVMGVAVIAAEDQRFAEHLGFDWKEIQKAIAHNERSKGKRGASTVSQQTAKNLFLWSERSWLRKCLEVYFTVLIEALWPKERILEVYLNVVEFGDGIFGVEAAARKNFNKPAGELRESEAALLAAVLPNPQRYHADQPSPYVRQRQEWILRQMHRLGAERYLEKLE